MRSRSLAVTFCLHLLVFFGAEVTSAAEDRFLAFSEMEFAGGFVTDTGHVVVAVTPPLDLEQVRSRLVSWNGNKADSQDIDFVVKWLREQSGGRFLVQGYRRGEEGSHPSAVDPYGNVLGFRVYRLVGTRFRLEEEFDLDPKWYDAAWVHVSSDLKLWVRMANLYPANVKRPAKRIGRQFALGSLKSGKTRRTIGVEFRHADSVTWPEYDTGAFEILDSDGPIVLASYGTRLYLLRFHDDGVETRPVDHLRSVVHPSGGDLAVVWQHDESVLWAHVGDEWLAFDLWTLPYTLEIPQEPFLRRKASSGRPHPDRGFVALEEGADGRVRVRHSWQSPQFPDWREDHVSDWQSGKASWRNLLKSRFPRMLMTSPNGRHLLVAETSQSEDGTYSTTVRRVGMSFALPPPPPPRPEATPQEPQEDGERSPPVPEPGG